MSHSTNDLREPLFADWRQLLLPLGVADDAVAAAFIDLVGRYDEPFRRYHNRAHLREVLAVIDQLAPLVGDITAVRLAAWFHDAVYDSRAQDNEERSAALAEAVLSGFGVARTLIASVARLVQLTKTHCADAADRDGQLLLDADLSILGANADRYDEYARAIRQEYAWMAEHAYRDGRGRVLGGFLQRPRIYLTDALFRSHEQRARHNLQRELTLLRATRGESPVQVDVAP
jgi:predicted metal-dependent HD superfamily phosphohydrolase